jgi:hypothetical protein
MTNFLEIHAAHVAARRHSAVRWGVYVGLLGYAKNCEPFAAHVDRIYQ